MTNLFEQAPWDDPGTEAGSSGMPLQSSLLVQDDGMQTRCSRYVSAGVVIEHIEARSRRATFFEADMFSDPAWDLLLRLYVAYLEQRRVSIIQLTLSAGVPQSTALRWIARLHSRGWITRAQDPLDERRVFIGLTFRGWAAFNGYFASCGFAPPRI